MDRICPTHQAEVRQLSDSQAAALSLAKEGGEQARRGLSPRFRRRWRQEQAGFALIPPPPVSPFLFPLGSPLAQVARELPSPLSLSASHLSVAPHYAPQHLHNPHTLCVRVHERRMRVCECARVCLCFI